jgi:hypothetical protein
MLPKQVYGIRLSPGWIEVRASSRPLKLIVTSTPRKWTEEINQVIPIRTPYVDAEGHNRYLNEYKQVTKTVEKSEKLILRHVEGGIPLCCISYQKWLRAGYDHTFPTPTEETPAVKLPKQFLSRKWRNRTFRLDLEAEPMVQ